MARVFQHEALLRARLELGLTQEGVAAAVGVDVRTYRRYEAGEVNDPREGFSIRHPSRRRIVERMCAELGLDESDLLVEPHAAAPPIPPADPPAPAPSVPRFRPLHAHTLQRARHFVGREDLLARLSAWVAAPDPSPGVLALVGVGGAGKTAVVEHLLARLGDAPRDHGVLVWSFYDDPRTESFLAQATRYFAGEEGPPGERISRLEDALRGGLAHLVVLDGLETVQDEGGGGRAHGELRDPLLRRLLCALARGLGRARALVTSRFSLSDLAPWADAGAEMLALPLLSTTESSRLLRQWGVRGDEAALGRLSSGAGGHALSVAVIGSYVGAFLRGDAGMFGMADLAEAARDEPLARRLSAVLAEYAQALSPGERDLVARLSVLPAGADEEALLALARAGGEVAGQMAGWKAPELRRGLSRLARLGLVFQAGGAPPRWSTHPFVREHFRMLLGVPPGTLHAALDADRPAATLVGAPRRPPRDSASLDAHEALIERLVGAGRALDAYLLYVRGLGGFAHLGLVLGEMSRGARIVRAFGEGDDPRRFDPTLPPSMRAALAYDRGLYAGALGDLAFARHCYEVHNEVAVALSPSALVTGLRTLAYTERLAGALAAAREHVERSIAIAEAEDLPEHAARGVALLAAILDDLGELDRAEATFARLREMGDAPVARRGLWEAEHRLRMGQRREAMAMTARNVELCARRGWEGHVAHGHVVLGMAAVEEDPEEAGAHLEKARRWVAVSGEVEMALRCYELSARVSLARGETEKAAREAAEGARIAEVCGFGPMGARLSGLVSPGSPPASG
jgi:transcriptional regulator with XRE-family HTH domain